MMTKNLFRGKRTDTSEWIEGALIQFKGETEIADYNSVDCGVYDVDPKTVGQFTGVIDVNGVNICEGDIIRNDVCDCKVEYVAPEFVRHVIKHDLRNQIYPFKNHHSYEVVGNIHDNPELLNQ